MARRKAVVGPEGVSYVDMTKTEEAAHEADLEAQRPSLAVVQARLKAAVDRDAETVRLRYITPGAGQAMTYQQKLEDAKAVVLGETDPDNVPILAASVGIEGETLNECALFVLGTWDKWRGIAKQIEVARLTAKKAITEAAHADEAQAAYKAIVWP